MLATVRWDKGLNPISPRFLPSCSTGLVHSRELLSDMKSVDLLTLLYGPLQPVPGSGRSLENPGIVRAF